jgi:ACS family hexuronate transporter-like MFS transporter
MDRMGTRRGYALAITLWSFAAIAHAFAFSAFTFGVARALLGLGEASNFPACIKTVAEWFPKSERALATGIFNAGANIGAVVATLTVPWLALTFGWQAAFIGTGALGFVWLGFWLLIYSRPEEHRSISARELGYIQADPPDKAPSYPWAGLFPKRETWAFAIGKGLTDPIWWFYLFWLPKYLQETFGLTLQQIILPTLVVYNVCSIGSVAGGWLSSGLIQRGWTVNRARKTAMLICALAVVPVLYAPYCKSLWGVVGLVGLATAAHQGWSANLFTTVSDMFPRSAVGSVVGIGGTLGAVASVALQIATGYIVELTHSYLPLFIISGSAYVVALAIIHGLSPRLVPAELDR